MFDDMVGRILATYDAATPEQLRDGRAWYAGMLAVMRAHADDTGYTVDQCADVYAACSINTPWTRNIELASRAIAQGRLDGGTLTHVCGLVDSILAGVGTVHTLIKSTDARKIRCFSRNLAGDHDAVTVDRWANRVATGADDVPRGMRYDAIADAYRYAADMRDVSPAVMQATTWCVVRDKVVPMV